jgi:cyanophycinase
MDAVAATNTAVSYSSRHEQLALLAPRTNRSPSRMPAGSFRWDRPAWPLAALLTMTLMGTMLVATLAPNRCLADDAAAAASAPAGKTPSDPPPAADLAAAAKQALAAGKLVTDKLVTDKLVTDRLVTDKLVTGKLVTGKLVICGGGRLPDQLPRRFIEFAGGTAAHVVVVTTASVYADTDKMEPKLAFWREQKLASLTILHTRSRETANEIEFAKPLTAATGVWFVGGNQSWLTETYLGTATERELRGVLARGGVVGGTSAGAAIMSPIMIRRDKPELETCLGFGFLPGTVVDQHFLKRNRQGRLMKVLDSHRDLVGLGIDEGTALVVDGNHLSVVGESEVVVCSPASTDRPAEVHSLAAGAEADLRELRTAWAVHLVAKPVVPVEAPAPAVAAANTSAGGESGDTEPVATVDATSASVSAPAEDVKVGQ